jgi:predicted ATPase
LPLAERRARELIEREPYRESGYGLLMEAHVARGNVAEALRVYDELRRLLREELGLTPAPGVTAMASRLLEAEDAQGSPPAVVGTQDPIVPLPPALACASRAPLVGRRAELERLLASVNGRTPGSYRMLVISGAAGIGKTRLASAVAAAARERGCDVLYGRVHRPPLARNQPVVEALRRYLGHDDSVARKLVDLFGNELTELARHLPELRRVVPAAGDDVSCDAETRRVRVFDAVAGLLEAIARRRPLLFVLEDVQWADPLTLGLIRHAVRASHGARLTLLLTARDDAIPTPELRALFVDVHRERALEHVVLGALCEAETAELAAAHPGPPAEGADRRSIFADSGGNPLLIEELLLGSATHPLLRA